MNRLLVIGADGFIGRAVCRVARSRGVETVAADKGRPGANRTARYVDITDRDGVRALLAETRPDAVVTLAAHASGDRGLLASAESDPVRAVDVNVRGLAIVLEECAVAGCERVVLSSSTTVYGPAGRYDAERVSEQVPLLPATVYGGTKAAAEAVAYPLATRLGIRVAAIRLPLVYGGGRWYGGSQQDLVEFVEALTAGQPASIRAWTRPADWMHVTDAAGSLLDAAASGTAAGPYNVVGHTNSLAELANALAAHADAPTEVTAVPAAGPDIPLVDDRRARRELPLTVQYDSLDGGAKAYLSEIRSLP